MADKVLALILCYLLLILFTLNVGLTCLNEITKTLTGSQKTEADNRMMIGNDESIQKDD